MRRLTILTVLLTLAPAAAVSAKEVTAMEICGREGCAPLERSVAQSFHDDGSLWGAMLDRNPGHVRWYRLTMFFSDGSGKVVGRVKSAYAPSERAIVSLDAVPETPWQRVSAKGAAVLERKAAGLTPFAARRFGPAAERPVAEKPVAAKPEEDDDFPLIAGVPALALLLGAGLLIARRR